MSNDNSHFTQLQNNRACSPLKNNAHMACTCPSKDTCPDSSFGSLKPISAFSQWCFQILLYLSVQTLTSTSFDFLHKPRFIMNATDYWPLARKYLIWNATVAALQLWTADLEAHVLNHWTSYNAFFYTTSTHLLHQQSEEILFGHFMTMLNAAFESKLTLEDEGYEGGSEGFNIPTPLRCTPKIHHVSSDDNISFDPSTPCSTTTNQSCH